MTTTVLAPALSSADLAAQHELAHQALQAFLSCHTTLSVLARHVHPDAAHTVHAIQHDLLFDPALNLIKLGEQLDLDFLTPLKKIFPSIKR
jgi:hypothetical protein